MEPFEGLVNGTYNLMYHVQDEACIRYKSVVFESLLSLTRLSAYAKEGGCLWKKERSRKFGALLQINVTSASAQTFFSFVLSTVFRSKIDVERRRWKNDNVIKITLKKNRCLLRNIRCIRGETTRACFMLQRVKFNYPISQYPHRKSNLSRVRSASICGTFR